MVTPSDQTWLGRQLRITWHLPLVLAVLAAALGLWQTRPWLCSSPPRVVRLAGTHEEIGRAHGRILVADIRALWDGYVLDGLVAREGWSRDDLIAVGRHYEPFIPDAYRVEMLGIAEGANIPYEHVLVMNTFADAVLGPPVHACSAFAIRTDQGLLVGRNLDWTNYGVAHRHGVVFVLEPEGGHRLLHVGWPGMVGVVTGLNERGLAVALNMAYAGDLTTEATPMLFRLRRSLEAAASIDAATGIILAQPRTIAANVLAASQNEDRAEVLELSGQRNARVAMRDGLVVTTNHYQALDIRGGVGGERTLLLRSMLSRSGRRTSPAGARRALAAVAFRGDPEGMVTTQSVVFRPGDLAADVAMGQLPATAGRWFEVRIER